VLGKWKSIDWSVLSQYALGWLVKGYFLPIMFGDVANNIGYLRGANWDLFSLGFVPAFNLLFSALIHLELIFVSAGYIFTCRLFDSHIRAVEKTLFGWVVAVVSYSPLLSLVYVRYFAYSADSINWLTWLGGHPTILTVWGSVILALLVLHLWCDACFGVRFSNLTHRGIITNGPYRFSKHPAYVIKSIRWWLVAVPFIAVSWHEALRFSLLLICVNLLYTLRGYAEERMLSQDPTYVAYARWMDRHGLLRFLGKRFPVLSYEWRLQRWQKQGIVTTPQ
jgi:isoprenylcysteine carboxyl methyltransferase (ICMT) family protein YpbQ